MTSSNSESVHTLVSAIVLYKSYTIATPKHLEPFLPKNYIRIVAFAPNLHRAFFYSRIDFLPYSTTVKLLPLLILIIGSYSSLRTSLRCLGVIASLVSAVARKFMQGCHPDQYLQPEQSLILASSKQPHNHQCNLLTVAATSVAARLWLCGVLASWPVNLGHASSQPTHLLQNSPPHKGVVGAGRPPSLLA